MPPIIGAAIRFMISEPVPVDQRIGTNPIVIVAKFVNFGRRGFAAPSAILVLDQVSASRTVLQISTDSVQAGTRVNTGEILDTSPRRNEASASSR
jgi:hypothetical protein